jgi:hypothetical protein
MKYVSVFALLALLLIVGLVGYCGGKHFGYREGVVAGYEAHPNYGTFDHTGKVVEVTEVGENGYFDVTFEDGVKMSLEHYSAVFGKGQTIEVKMLDGVVMVASPPTRKEYP